MDNKPWLRGIGARSLSSYLTKKPRVEFYVGNDKKNWWRLWFSSDIVCASSQGYATEALAKENFLKVEEHIKFLREAKEV